MESYYRFKGTELEPLKKVWLEPRRGLLSDEFFNMDGLGALYSRVSSYIFADWNKCGEVMGLAPYGQPDAFRRLIEVKKNGELDIPAWDETFNQPWAPDGEKKWEDSPAMKHWEDMAWRVQHDSEEMLIERARWLRETTGAKNLCLAGGVALNCVANGRIVREAGFDNVWIQPAAGDNGIAIGCALYGHLAVQKKPRSFVMKQATLGREYTEGDVRRDRQAAAGQSQDLQRHPTRASAAKPPSCWRTARCSAGFRAAPSSARARSATAASWAIRAGPR